MRSWLHRLWGHVLSFCGPTTPQDEAGAKSVGRQGEELAAAHLRKTGYIILERNVKSRFGELDIVARHGEVLCFVEVKTRRGEGFGPAVAAVAKAKQRQIERAAIDYARKRGVLDADCRFDVVAVTLPETGQPAVEVFEAAFEASLRL